MKINKSQALLPFVTLILVFFFGCKLTAGNGSALDGGPGWTLFSPSPDSRIVFVANDGNDGTGQVYTPNQIHDPFNPGAVQAYATFSAASAQIRDGYPDWILFRRGDTFRENLTLISGRSITEKALIGAYGTENSMPEINPLNEAEYAVTIPSNTEFSVLTGIDFHAVNRNPSTAGYTIEGSGGFSGLTNTVIRSVLIEGCRFRFFAGNVFQGYDGGSVEDITIRRCVISDNYSNGEGHSQGLYSGNANGLVLEENIFDHNGWFSQAPLEPGTATMFNHNTYFEDCHNVVFTGNIFSRASSMGNKFTANSGVASSTNITIRDNLYLDGEIGIGLGGNTVGEYRFRNILIEGNVLTEIGRSQPTGRTLGWAIDAVGWDGGTISANYLLHFSNPSVTHIYGIRLEGGTRAVKIEKNIFYNLNPHGNSNMAPALLLAENRTATPSQGISVYQNFVQEPNNQLFVFQVDNTNELAAVNLYDNTYYSASQATAFRMVDDTISLETWKIMTQDNSNFSSASFPFPQRSIATYMQYIGETETIEAFIDACRSQNQQNWDPRFTAGAVLSWIKEGF